MSADFVMLGSTVFKPRKWAAVSVPELERYTAAGFGGAEEPADLTLNQGDQDLFQIGGGLR